MASEDSSTRTMPGAFPDDHTSAHDAYLDTEHGTYAGLFYKLGPDASRSTTECVVCLSQLRASTLTLRHDACKNSACVGCMEQALAFATPVSCAAPGCGCSGVRCLFCRNMLEYKRPSWLKQGLGFRVYPPRSPQFESIAGDMCSLVGLFEVWKERDEDEDETSSVTWLVEVRTVLGSDELLNFRCFSERDGKWESLGLSELQDWNNTVLAVQDFEIIVA